MYGRASLSNILQDSYARPNGGNPDDFDTILTVEGRLVPKCQDKQRPYSPGSMYDACSSFIRLHVK